LHHIARSSCFLHICVNLNHGFAKLYILLCIFVSAIVMDAFMETAVFFEKADNTLHDIVQLLVNGSDIPPRQYISVLKECLSGIQVLKVYYVKIIMKYLKVI